MTEQEEFEFRLRLERERTAPAPKQAPAAPSATSLPSPYLGGMSLDQVRSGAVGLARGAKDVIDTGADLLSRLGPEGENARVKAMNQAGKAEFDAEYGKDTAAKVGRLGGQIAITYPIGGAIAAPFRAAGLAPVANAIETAGFRTGLAPTTALGQAGNTALRVVGGAVTGGASAGAIDPNQAGLGALIGGGLPGGVAAGGALGKWVGGKVADATNWGAERLMQSALKPTIAQLRSGEAAIAVRTLLDKGINATGAGVNKLRALIDDANTEIATKIAASPATIDKGAVVGTLGGTRARFGNQVSPAGDLAAIDAVEQGFMAHPNLPGQTIPVQQAQQLKQGTYRVLKDKYGQLGSAETEAQKALARGLKEEIATAVPGIGPLNAEESRLLATLSVAERRALMDMNKNPMGLAALAGNPVSWAAFMADRSAAFKSLAARALNNAAQGNGLQRIANAVPEQLMYRAAPVVAADQ